MTRPNMEAWAHAEHDRQRALEARHEAAQATALEQYRYQVESMPGPSLTVSTGMGVLGGIGSTWVSDGTYYPSDLSPPGLSSIIAVDALGYNALKAELEEAKRTIAEQAEIIEALAADGDELDSLRAENEKLRAELFERVPPAIPSKFWGPEWNHWTPGPDSICPIVDRDIMIEVILRDYLGPQGNVSSAGFYTWSECGSSSIVAYRTVEC